MTLNKYIKTHRRNIIFKYLIFFLFFFYFLYKLDLSFAEFLDGFKRLSTLISSMTRIEFEDYKIVLLKVWETFIIAFSSSLFGLILAIIFTPFLTSFVIKNTFVTKIIASIFTVFRTVPALVFAAILVSLIGVGSFTGFVALSIFSFFSSSKLLKEYLEEIREEKIRAFKSLGMGKFLFLKSCILPIAKPYIISLFFLTLESSIRGASVLGMVGAGGIGQELWKNLSYLRYDKVAFIILVLVAFIFLTDTISWFFRKKDSYIVVNSFSGYKRQKLFSKILYFIILSFTFYSVIILYKNSGSISTKIFLERLFNFLEKVNKIDFSYINRALIKLFESFLVAFFATLLAAPTAIILSFFASSNTFYPKVAFIIKLFINFIRTFPPIIVAVIFFSGFGPGMMSGFAALYIYTTGMMIKLFVDNLESSNIDYGIYGRSLGLNKFYVYLKLWLPSCYTNFISIVLYRFESNMKNSSVLGMVGAGGIGELLINHIGFRNWEKVWLLLIVLIIAIIIIENISIFIRKKINK